MTLTTGQVLQNRYRIVSSLGEGGMGAVYRAWDTRLNVPVALKEMIPQPGLDTHALAQLRRQFEQEAQVLARLDHPHLVRVTDFFSWQGSEYLVMNYVAGESLADRIEREGALPETEVLAWAEQLLDALGYCHAQGIIHRDVKPQNVIITLSPTSGEGRGGGRAVLVDFGLVKLWDPGDPRTKTAMRGMGTPEYAPPEQYDIQMGHTDPRSDIYGLGATLYHALTGQSPLTATMRMADPEQFALLRSIVPGVSERTEAAVLKAVELARSQRWQDAAEMAQALGGSAVAPARSAVPKRQPTKLMPGTQPAAPPRKRVPVWAWALGGLAVLALVVGGVMGFGGIGGGSTPTPTETVVALEMVQETATPLPSPTATATRTPTSTPTRTPTPTPPPPPTLTGPDDGIAFYYYANREIALTWEWAASQPGSRYRVVIEDENGQSLLADPEDGVTEEMEFRFRLAEMGISLETYRWTVMVERNVDGEWEELTQAEWRAMRFVPPPTPTFTPVPPTPTPVPQEPQPQPPQPPQPQPTQPPPPPPTEPPPPPTEPPPPPPYP